MWKIGPECAAQHSANVPASTRNCGLRSARAASERRTPPSGLATGAGDFPVQFFGWNLPPILSGDKALSETLYDLHAIVGNAILTLILVHVGAAIWHAAVKKDGVLRRMI